MFRLYQSCLRNRFMRSLIAGGAMFGFVLFCALLIVFVYFERKAFGYDIEVVGQLPFETTVVDATDTPIGVVNAVKGGNLPLEAVSPNFLQALISREDSRFWKHHGVDHIGILRANIRNIQEKKFVQGASTITMQLSRMTYELRERSFQRKLVEAAVARRIERRHPKKEILRLYVNQIFLGTGMHGIEQAAQGYFGKHPSQLSLSESAMIAGIIRAPNGFSPFRNYRAALREMGTTLDRMVDEKMITVAEAVHAKKVQPVVLDQRRWMKMLQAKESRFEKTWFLNMVEAQLPDLIEEPEGGYTVKVTIDHRLQNSTMKAVQKWLAGVERVPGYSHPVYPAVSESGEPDYLQGAGVVIDNFSGAIRAMVGGRNYGHSEFNRAIHKNRQAGSIIKPLVYATAFETGMFPGTLVSDEKIQEGEFDWWSGPSWNPVNADDVYSGLKPAEEGLIRSRNTMTVRVGETAGIDNVHRMLQHAGMAGEDIQKDPQIYIGNITVSLLDTTSAYTAFATEGARFEPYLIERIQDRNGAIVYQHEARKYQVFSPEAAWITSSILQKVVEQGGSGARLRQWGFDAPAGSTLR